MAEDEAKSKVLSFWPSLAPPEPTLQPAIIEHLERLLRRAKDGNIKALSYCVIDPTNAIGTDWVGAADQHLVIAGTEILRARVMEAYLADGADVESGPGA